HTVIRGAEIRVVALRIVGHVRAACVQNALVERAREVVGTKSVVGPERALAGARARIMRALDVVVALLVVGHVQAFPARAAVVGAAVSAVVAFLDVGAGVSRIVADVHGAMHLVVAELRSGPSRRLRDAALVLARRVAPVTGGGV